MESKIKATPRLTQMLIKRACGVDGREWPPMLKKQIRIAMPTKIKE
jgi:hypothetical protein